MACSISIELISGAQSGCATQSTGQLTTQGPSTTSLQLMSLEPPTALYIIITLLITQSFTDEDDDEEMVTISRKDYEMLKLKERAMDVVQVRDQHCMPWRAWMLGQQYGSHQGVRRMRNAGPVHAWPGQLGTWLCMACRLVGAC